MVYSYVDEYIDRHDIKVGIAELIKDDTAVMLIYRIANTNKLEWFVYAKDDLNINFDNNKITEV